MENKQIESYSQQISQNAKNYLVPSGLEILAYSVFSVLTLGLLSAHDYWNHFVAPLSGGDTSLNVSQNIERVISSDTQNRVGQALFWAVLGIVVYVFLWLARNAFYNIYNDVTAGHYIQPGTKAMDNFWRAIIFRKAFLVGSFFVWLGFIILLVKLLPSIARGLYSQVANFHWLHSILTGLFDIFATAVLLYVFSLLTRVTLHSLVTVYRGL